MKPQHVFMLFGFVLVLAAGPASARQQEEASGLRSGPASGVHEFTVRAGFLGDLGGETRTSVSGVSVDAGGALGILQYDYWAHPEWAVGVAVGGVAVDADVSVGSGGVRTSSETLALVHLGVTYRPALLAQAPSVKPFLYMSAGPYIGSLATVGVGTPVRIEHRTESTMGLRALLGMDVLIGRFFKVGFAGGYHLIGSLDRGTGEEIDRSGAEFSIGLGVRFGGS